MIVTLKQPAVLRCLAGGNPNPVVAWWRGNDMVPLKGPHFEVRRDFSLVFKHVDLSDLGKYTCQAWSGEGKAVSIEITLKAIGPVHVSNEEDRKYLEFLVSAAEPTTTPRPSYPYRPSRPTPRVVPKPFIPVYTSPQPERPPPPPPERPRSGKFIFFCFV